jgi:pilus assembly protein CpaF
MKECVTSKWGFVCKFRPYGICFSFEGPLSAWHQVIGEHLELDSCVPWPWWLTQLIEDFVQNHPKRALGVCQLGESALPSFFSDVVDFLFEKSRSIPWKVGMFLGDPVLLLCLRAFYWELVGLGQLGMWATQGFSEILIQEDGVVFLEREGTLKPPESLQVAPFQLNPGFQWLWNRLLLHTGKNGDAQHPKTQAALWPKGFSSLLPTCRLQLVCPPLSSKRLIQVRVPRLKSSGFELWDISLKMRYFLENAVEHRSNILVCGATGAGKTTFLKALLSAVPKHDRVLILEDTPELPCPEGLPWDRLVASALHTLSDCVSLAMRLRPDRLILGEARGLEAWDVLKALGTGHGGSMASVHGGSAQQGLARLLQLGLETPSVTTEMMKESLVGGVEVVVCVSKTPDGRHVLKEVWQRKSQWQQRWNGQWEEAYERVQG